MKKLNIIYEDKDLLVLNKPANLLTIATEKRETNTTYRLASDYVKKAHPKNKIFIVHRLDRETSGIIIFAKNEKIKHLLQDDWNTRALKREYIAIVENKPPKDKDRLINYLQETKTHYTYCTTNNTGQLAITNYQVINHHKNYTSLQITIETGRKNQIRTQLANIGCPIIGDKKYHALTNPIHRLGLHALKITITHPVTNQQLTFQTEIPPQFLQFL